VRANPARRRTVDATSPRRRLPNRRGADRAAHFVRPPTEKVRQPKPGTTTESDASEEAKRPTTRAADKDDDASARTTSTTRTLAGADSIKGDAADTSRHHPSTPPTRRAKQLNAQTRSSGLTLDGAGLLYLSSASTHWSASHSSSSVNPVAACSAPG
jgi:hypothetical protein